MGTLSLKTEVKLNETILSALFSFGVLLLGSLIISNIKEIGLFYTIIYFAPLLIAWHYVDLPELGKYLLKSYAPKTSLEYFLVVLTLVLMIGFYFIIPLINGVFPKDVVEKTLFIKWWTPGYLIYFLALGKVLGNWISLIFNKTVFFEEEQRSRQILKATHLLLGIFAVPFVYAIILDMTIWVPFNVFLEMHDLFFSLLLASIGLFMFVTYYPLVEKHTILFFKTDKYFDQYRILKSLYSSPKNKKSLEKFVEKKDKLDIILNGWIKNGVVVQRDKKFYISEKFLNEIKKFATPKT